MLKLYLLSLRQAIKSHKLLLSFILLGITAGMFCISMTLGSARGDYENSLNINYLTTVTVSFESEDASRADAFSQMESGFQGELLNVLSITKAQDGTLLVGWYGSAQTHWFPHVNGRFFRQSEVKAGERVAYITHDEYTGLVKEGRTDTVQIDGLNYRIVGTGWISPFNLKYPISESSSQQLLQSEDNADYRFCIIPYSTFLKTYAPELILVQFDHMDYQTLEARCAQLAQMFPDAEVTMPSESSEHYLQAEKAKRSAIGALFAVIIGVSVLGLMMEWLKLNRKQYYVFLLCGATRRQTVGLILLEWFSYLLAGTCLAVGLHAAFLPWMDVFGAGYLPEWKDIVLFFLLFYGISVMASLKKIHSYVDILGKEDLL